uniref:Uncharacterized protein n=1 Tax=Cucumis sativus TaxID=3659 RepID=A0A0A0LJ43_CUCSA
MTFIISFIEIKRITKCIVMEISGSRVTTSMATESGNETRKSIFNIMTLTRSGLILCRRTSHERSRRRFTVGRNRHHPPVVMMMVVMKMMMAIPVLTKATR